MREFHDRSRPEGAAVIHRQQPEVAQQEHLVCGECPPAFGPGDTPGPRFGQGGAVDPHGVPGYLDDLTGKPDDALHEMPRLLSRYDYYLIARALAGRTLKGMAETFDIESARAVNPRFTAEVT